jgi:hypothetical protein
MQRKQLERIIPKTPTSKMRIVQKEERNAKGMDKNMKGVKGKKEVIFSRPSVFGVN